MRIRLLISVVVAFGCLCEAAPGGAKPNFSGTWVLDKDRSFSNPPGLDQTLVVTQTEEQIKLESKLVTARGEQTINETYTLDGKETDFTPPSGPPGVKGKRTASWLPDSRGILIKDVTTTDSPKGPVTGQVTRKWTISADGNVLTVDYYFDDQRGSFEAKRVFVKK